MGAVRDKLAQLRADAETHNWAPLESGADAGTEVVICVTCTATGRRDWIARDGLRRYVNTVTGAGKCPLQAPPELELTMDQRRRRRAVFVWMALVAIACGIGTVLAHRATPRNDLAALLFVVWGVTSQLVGLQRLALERVRKDGWKREREGERDAAR